MDAEDPALEAHRFVDGAQGRRLRRGRGRVTIVGGRGDLLDDRPVPRELSPGMNPIDRGSRTRARLVLAELTSQVVGPRPLLAILPQGHPNFLLLAHGWRSLRTGRKDLRIDHGPDPDRSAPDRPGSLRDDGRALRVP